MVLIFPGVLFQVSSFTKSDCRDFIANNEYVLWNVYLPNALHSRGLNRLSCTEVGIYNGANSPNGFLTPAVALYIRGRLLFLIV